MPIINHERIQCYPEEPGVYRKIVKRLEKGRSELEVLGTQ
jgi:hypothetical protein